MKMLEREWKKDNLSLVWKWILQQHRTRVYLSLRLPKIWASTWTEKNRYYSPGSGHTDGDSVIHFTKQTWHAGDIFFNGKFPFIDVSSGGSIDGIISLQSVLNRYQQNTKIIPGHGPLASVKDLEAYIEMLKSSKKSCQLKSLRARA